MANLTAWINALHCPTREQMIDIAVALLPRGRAWQNHETGPDAGAPGGFSKKAFQNDAFAVDYRPPSVLRQFWAAVGEFLTFTAQRFCALRLEFWCATHSETHDLWMKEYGLPDACDPFPDLCAKVAAIGGTRCEYYAMIAARAGWDIRCIDKENRCGSRAGHGLAKAGRAQPGAVRRQPYLSILVDLKNSPAYVAGPRARRAMAGRTKAGRRLICPVPSVINLNSLECLMARVVHAEIVIEYGAIENV